MFYSHRILKHLNKSLFAILLLAALSPGLSQAATVSYTLENLILDNNTQMTGSFDWNYTPGDFENGNGTFTEIYIPTYGSDLSGLNITVGVAELDFSLNVNIHSGGVNVNLFLLSPLMTGQPSAIDLSRSAYEFEIGTQRGGFTSGSIVPNPVPVPSALLLLCSGLFAMTGFARRKQS